MRKDVLLKPAGSMLNPDFFRSFHNLESLHKKYETAQEKNSPNLQSCMNCWRDNFNNAITKARLHQNIEALKMLQTLTPPTRKIQKKLALTILQLENNCINQARRKDRIKAQERAIISRAPVPGAFPQLVTM